MKDSSLRSILIEVLASYSPSIGGAERAIEGTAPNGITVVLSEFSNHPAYSIAVKDQAQIFIRTMERVKSFAEVLRQDPSGFALIDFVIQDCQVSWYDFPSYSHFV